jgi:hypothetical protein
VCYALFDAELQLKTKERSRRELYSAPANPVFIKIWRHYESNYSAYIYQIVRPDLPQWDDYFPGDKPESTKSLEVDPKALAELFSDTPLEPESDENKHETAASALRGDFTCWEHIDEAAYSSAQDIEFVINWMENHLDELRDNGHEIDHPSTGSSARPTMKELRFDARNGIAAWRRFINDIGFGLHGVLRRRALAPFVIIPRHVSGHYGASDHYSLMARLQQAQEAFVYGVPLGALAIMRSILEIILRKHYRLGDGKLVKLIETATATGLFPDEIRLSGIQKLLKLGNDAVHPNPEELHKISDIEMEVLSLLFILRTLIERVPKSVAP